eukprot:TRINITY_DN65057_c0_g1_i1.p1 TRINITY_DN65057_c0_g1~~TRINITY_DN65057_c0_g1_i1.p1  ORF type:complete len:300 (-),score=29.74 TRINITY_DN65057_c0_g1_i1:119-1018(-)
MSRGTMSLFPAQIELAALSRIWVACGFALLCIWLLVMKVVPHFLPDLKVPANVAAIKEYVTTHFRYTISCFFVVAVLMPTLVFTCGLLLGGVLAASEGWRFDDGYEYIVGNMVGIGPMSSLTPNSTSGKIADIIISLFGFVLCNVMLGLAANLNLIVHATNRTPPTLGGLCRVLFLYIPIALTCLSFLCGCVLSALEGWDLADGLYFMVGYLCGIANPLTPKAPVTDKANFALAVISVIEMCVAGAIIGLVGAHPFFQSVLLHLEGSYGNETEAIVDTKDANQELNSGDTRAPASEVSL